MMNNIYKQLNANSLQSLFNNFRSTFKGNPREEVQKLLDSGTMSQEQFNMLANQATQLQNLLKM